MLLDMRVVVEGISSLLAIVILAACETTSVSAQKGNQEAKRMAAIERLKQQQQRPDEAQANLWNAQEQLIDRDGNPMRAY